MPFDVAIEHFSFPLYHRIVEVNELAKMRLLSRLTSASFSGTALDDRGLSHVVAVPTIDNLDLQETQISNAGLAHLAQLPRLMHLRLKDNRQLTNDCIPHLLRLEALVDLQIHETSIDDRGVSQLAALVNLRNLVVDVSDDNYSFHVLLELSGRMPQCTILAKGRGELRDGELTGTWR